MQKSTSEIKSYKFNTLRVMDNPNRLPVTVPSSIFIAIYNKYVFYLCKDKWRLPDFIFEAASGMLY